MSGDERPVASTLAAVLIARAGARLAVSRAGDAYQAALWEAFRNELGSSVDRVSPLLVALLARERLSLDGVAWSITPGRGWPFRPLSHGQFPGARTGGHRYAVHDTAGGPPRAAGPPIGVADGGRIRVEVVDGSLEVRGRAGAAWIATASGVARLTVPGAVPARVARAAIGHPAAALVDLAVLRGRDWPVLAVERRGDGSKSTFVVWTGSRPYALPWTRPP